MAKFINTSATTYYLEEIIKNASDRLILISPYLRLNDRIKELLEDKNRLKIDVRIVYGKTDLRPDEADWLKGLEFVRTSFCKNLHAKCYMSEAGCIITSLNLSDENTPSSDLTGQSDDENTDGVSNNTDLLTTSKLGSKHKQSTAKVFERLTAEGYLEDRGGKPYLTAKGVSIGASWRPGRFGGYFLWPATIFGE